MFFNINNSIWQIKEVESEIILKRYNEGMDEEGTYCFGLTLYPEHEIWLNKSMCDDQKIKTLKHELTHCFIWNYGLYNVRYSEEVVCDLVTSSNDFINDIVGKFKSNKKKQ